MNGTGILEFVEGPVRVSLLSLLGWTCSTGSGLDSKERHQTIKTTFAQHQISQEMSEHNTRDTITLGAGCFWCVEAIFESLDGVISVESGYANGHKANPTYKEVCTGNTGHAEVCKLVYDPKEIGLNEILEVFWQTHDPTTLNRQGADVGTQYRSGVYYHSEEQGRLARAYKEKLDQSGAFDRPIVTEILPVKNYYPAEDYHQEYFKNNPEAAYCQMVIRPKVEKFQKVFSEKLKP